MVPAAASAGLLAAKVASEIAILVRETLKETRNVRVTTLIDAAFTVVLAAKVWKQQKDRLALPNLEASVTMSQRQN